MDTLDLTEVGWQTKTLRRAFASGQDPQMSNAAKMVLHYDDPGAGGFYDNLGWPNDPRHLTRGEWQWGFMPFPGPAKMSHYNLAYSMLDPRGVTVEYQDLDPQVQYVVRISIGVHLDKGEQADMLGAIELKQGLLADGHVITDGFAIPRGDVTYQEFDLPRDMTHDGKLQITLTSSSNRLPITAAYEIWLMRKDRMPWTVRP